MSRLARPAVRRVIEALRAKGSSAEVIELSETARSAQDAADALDVEVGAIVKSLAFAIDDALVMVLLAGDRPCAFEALPAVFGLAGTPRRADAAAIKRVTGFSIGGVAPVGHVRPLPIAIDPSLERFATIYAAAGHPHCVFATSFAELCALTDARVDAALAGG